MRTKFMLRLSAVCVLGFLALLAIAGVLLAEGTVIPVAAPSLMRTRCKRAKCHSAMTPN
jgi:hypothetical protein